MKNQIRLDNTSLFANFESHLEIADNERILFSAPFGTGKSTYLSEYFDMNGDKYFCFNLYPVNYSVSHNEDVFELIKFDLLLQLMGRYRDEVDLSKEDFSNILSFQALFLKEIKLTPILLSLLEESGKIGKSAKILIDEIRNQYQEFKERFEDEEKFITDYLINIENKIGQVNEMDSYSSMICKLLNRVKLKYSNKKSVLIIDDLDRLDPEHIFRLFNIFSVNFGKEEVLNKFGFDKIVFVCDIENIKNIYNHKYGSNVDFSGYIDKFYSKLPFEFDNRQLISSHLIHILPHLKINNQSKYFDDTSRYNRLYTAVKAIVYSMLMSKNLNLRMILNIDLIPQKNISFPFHKKTIAYFNSFPILQIFYLLKCYLGTYSDVKNVLEKLYNIYDNKSFTSSLQDDYFDDDNFAYDQILCYCLPFLIDFDENGRLVSDSVSESNKCIYSNIFGAFIHFDEFDGFRETKNGNKNFHFATKTEDRASERIILNPFEVLKVVFDECVKRRAVTL